MKSQTERPDWNVSLLAIAHLEIRPYAAGFKAERTIDVQDIWYSQNEGTIYVVVDLTPASRSVPMCSGSLYRHLLVAFSAAWGHPWLSK